MSTTSKPGSAWRARLPRQRPALSATAWALTAGTAFGVVRALGSVWPALVSGLLLSCVTFAVRSLPSATVSTGRSTERTGLEQLPAVVPLAGYWRKTSGAAALSDFIRAFDGTLHALKRNLSDRHGHEMASAMPLHQQVSFAGEFGIWSPGELADWRQCLTLRSQILTEGHAVSGPLLAQRTAWLRGLARRTRRRGMS